MAILIHCPSCTQQLRVPEHLLGKKVRCPGCKTLFVGEAEPATGPAPATQPYPNLTLDDEPAPAQARERFPPRPAPAAPPPPPARSPERRPEPPPRPRRRRFARDDLEPCPYCHELIRFDTPRCRFCGERIEVDDEDYERYDGPEERPWGGRTRAPLRYDCDPHRGGLILTLGIIALVSMVILWLAPLGLPFGIAAWVMGQSDLKKMDAGYMDPAGRGNTQSGRAMGMASTILGLIILGVIAFIVCLSILKDS